MNSKLKKIRNHIIDVWKDKYDLKWFLFIKETKRQIREFFGWLPFMLMIIFLFILALIGIFGFSAIVGISIYELIDYIINKIR